MTQVPIANSLTSAYQPAKPTPTLGTGAFGGGDFGQSRNASIGDQWGECPWNDTGTPNTINNGWNNPTNVDSFSPRTAMGSLGYGVPVFESNGASPPWMIKTDAIKPTRGTSYNSWDHRTDVNSYQPQTVIGDHEYEAPVPLSNSASPSSIIVCQCEVVPSTKGTQPTEENQPTGETEGGSGSVLGPIGAVVGTIGLGYTIYKMAQDSRSKSKYDGPTQLTHFYDTSKWKPATTNAMSAFAGKVQRTLGFAEEEGTSADKGGEHPYYCNDFGGTPGDEKGGIERSASFITHKPSVNTSPLGSTTTPNRKKSGPRSYTPE